MFRPTNWGHTHDGYYCGDYNDEDDGGDDEHDEGDDRDDANDNDKNAHGCDNDDDGHQHSH